MSTTVELTPKITFCLRILHRSDGTEYSHFRLRLDPVEVVVSAREIPDEIAQLVANRLLTYFEQHHGLKPTDLRKALQKARGAYIEEEMQKALTGAQTACSAELVQQDETMSIASGSQEHAESNHECWTLGVHKFWEFAKKCLLGSASSDRVTQKYILGGVIEEMPDVQYMIA
jgi:hypothetical protein